MERVAERLAMAESALVRLAEAMALEKPSALERDAPIQRFEFTFEALWKAARIFLAVREGIDSASPKGVIRACRETGLFSEDDAELALTMTDDRNLTVHTYNEPLAIVIHERLRRYYPLMVRWLAAMQDVCRNK